jgi:hypothetical protein
VVSGAASGGDLGPIEGTEARAAALHRAIGDKLPVADALARSELRRACRLTRIAESSWVEVVRYGEARRWWRLSDGALLPADVVESKAEDEPDLKAATWTGPTGDDLLVALGELSEALGDERTDAALATVGMSAADVETASEQRLRQAYTALLTAQG